ncbi:MAG: transcriptional repressor [Muribaculaceae bacterium]|nr:transcriptional repressor [Muribaculaceae bacterium]
MNNSEIEQILKEKGVKPTANRILVLRELMGCSHPVSLADLSRLLDPMDKASIFRTLELFSANDIIHVIEDGSRSLKYELCHGHGEHSLADQHAHFYCEKCGSVYCLDEVKMPEFSLPDNFLPKSVNLMFKGVCKECVNK